MQEVKFYVRLYEYNHEVLGAYIRRFSRMPWSEVTKKRGIGHGSMRNTIVHIIRVHDAWLNYVVRGRLKELARSRKEPGQFSSCKDLSKYLSETWSGIGELLDNLTEKDLSRKVKAPWMPGDYTLDDMLMQATLEQAHHIGELIGAFWQMDSAPPQMMWIPTLAHRKVSVY
jgi:uncharacterized damage-inducible protein DinB